MAPLTLVQRARMIPSLGGVEIGPWLTYAASSVKPGHAIVEVGCWLGAGTAHLALGAVESKAPIHCYDRWIASDNQVADAARRYNVHLSPGQNLLPVIQENVAGFGAEIHYHRGELVFATWTGGMIGLYVDDASKAEPIWRRSLRTFAPSFVPGETVIALMDYHFDEWDGEKCSAQKRFVAEHPDSFELLEDHLGGTTCAAFLFKQRWSA